MDLLVLDIYVGTWLKFEPVKLNQPGLGTTASRAALVVKQGLTKVGPSLQGRSTTPLSRLLLPISCSGSRKAGIFRRLCCQQTHGYSMHGTILHSSVT